MSRIRLVEADRQRLGCPEFLPIDFKTVTNREAIQLKKLGFPTTRVLFAALQADDAEFDFDAWTALVWLALRRSGVNADPAELEFSMPIEILDDEKEPEPVVVEGKAEEAQEASTN